MHYTVPYRLFVISVFVLIPFTNLHAASDHNNTSVEVSDARKIFERAKGYHDGQGVLQDLSHAFSLYVTAALLGNVDAKVNLGYMHFTGEGTEQNYYEARKWYSEAAAMGDADAIATLAMMDHRKLGVTTTNVAEISAPIVEVQQTVLGSNETLSLLSQPVEAVVEISEAQQVFEQAKAYHDGQGVTQDLAEAYSLYATAAQLGNVDAKVNLGYMFFVGEGTEQNYYEARNWYSQAAAAGDNDAISTLAMMDSLELGVATVDMTEILAPILRVQGSRVESDEMLDLGFEDATVTSDDTEIISTQTSIGVPDALLQESNLAIVLTQQKYPIKNASVISDKELSPDETSEPNALSSPADTEQSTALLNSYTTSKLEALFLSAYSHHPALNSLREQTNASREAIVEARGSYLPQVSLNGSIFKTDREGELQSGIDFNQNTTPKSVSLNLTQTLFNGGRRKLAKRNAQFVAEASQANFMDSAMQIAAEVIQDYMSLYRAQSEVNILSETVATLQDLEEIVIARRKIGDATTTDVSQANSQLISARAQLAASKADITNMQSILLSKTGQSVSLATLPFEATGAIPNNIDDMKQLARDRSAALKASEFTMLSREVTLKSEKRKRYPTVSLEANASSRRDTSPTILSDDDLNIGVSVSMPLYTGGIGASQTRQALSLYNAARFDYENVSRLIDLQVMGLWSQMQSNRGVIDAQRASVAANSETLTSVSEGQKAGITSSQDVLDAVRDKLTADLTLASAEHEQYTIRLLLRLLIGEIGAHDFDN